MTHYCMMNESKNIASKPERNFLDLNENATKSLEHIESSPVWDVFNCKWLHKKIRKGAIKWLNDVTQKYGKTRTN